MIQGSLRWHGAAMEVMRVTVGAIVGLVASGRPGIHSL
jgi:hypothetical protein